MAAKEWLVPLGLAALTFTGLLFVPEPGRDDDAAAEHEDPPLLYPFPGGAFVVDGPVHVLAIDRERTHDVGGPDEASWLSPHVVRIRTAPMPEGCDCVGPTWHVQLSGDRPQFGRGGYNATRVTLHVFDADGELIASNGNASEQARLTGQFGPEQLPSGLWYLGANATAPAGTQPLPLYARAFLGQMRPLLVGLPIGGIATTSTDAAQGLYGTLHVTAQVTQLAYAP